MNVLNGAYVVLTIASCAAGCATPAPASDSVRATTTLADVDGCNLLGKVIVADGPNAVVPSMRVFCSPRGLGLARVRGASPSRRPRAWGLNLAAGAALAHEVHEEVAEAAWCGAAAGTSIQYVIACGPAQRLTGMNHAKAGLVESLGPNGRGLVRFSRWAYFLRCRRGASAGL